MDFTIAFVQIFLWESCRHKIMSFTKMLAISLSIIVFPKPGSYGEMKSRTRITPAGACGRLGVAYDCCEYGYGVTFGHRDFAL